MAEGDGPGLEATNYFSPSTGSTGVSTCPAAYVRIDPRTLSRKILKYVVVHDCGRVIN